jgi:hypothetical protein
VDPTLSALVVLRPAGGELEGAITSERAAELHPDATAAAAVERYFRERGLDVAPRVALSFSITGPQSLFETVFGTRLTVEGEGTATTARTASGGVELPLGSLPADIAGAVQAVTFTLPPDFGPTRFGP